jgi:glyoxylase-like metal-dependent hydrolase (beta-lactamase superfamily II)
MRRHADLAGRQAQFGPGVLDTVDLIGAVCYTPVMARRIKRVLLGIGVVLTVVLLVLAALLARAPIAVTTTHPIDLERVRKLADDRGAGPDTIEVIEVCRVVFPKVLVVGDDYIGSQVFSMVAFVLRYADGSFGLIDTGMTREICTGLPSGQFFPEGQRRVDAALPAAKFVVLTHEHLDHAGGIAHFEGNVPGALLTPEQLNSKPGLEAGFTKERGGAFEPLVYGDLHAVAPGVVLIKAPGHTPGSQMVFVKTAAGKPLLFVGDIAWIEENLTRKLARPRLASTLGSEDHAAILDQLRAIVDVSEAGAALPIVGHDGAQFDALVAKNILQRSHG